MPDCDLRVGARHGDSEAGSAREPLPVPCAYSVAVNLTTLGDEATEIEGAGREYVLNVTAVLTLILLALGAGVSVGVSGDRPEVVLTLPFLLTGLLIYLLQLLTEFEARRGIRRAIEDALEREGAALLISGRTLSTAVPSQRLSVIASGLLFASAVLATGAVACVVGVDYFFSSVERDGLSWQVLGVCYLLALSFSIVPLCSAAYESNTIGDRAYELAAERLNRISGPSVTTASTI